MEPPLEEEIKKEQNDDQEISNIIKNDCDYPMNEIKDESTLEIKEEIREEIKTEPVENDINQISAISDGGMYKNTLINAQQARNLKSTSKKIVKSNKSIFFEKLHFWQF